MGYLEGAKCYLSQPIEHRAGVDWKIVVAKELTNRFGIDLFDPALDEKQKRAELLEAAMDEGDFDEVERIATSFVKKDLGEIDRTDFLIAYNPYQVCTTGVPCEVHHAVQLKKPVQIVCPQGKRFGARWYFGYIRHRYIYGAWTDLYDYLQEVDDGMHKDNHRWHYVYKMV